MRRPLRSAAVLAVAAVVILGACGSEPAPRTVRTIPPGLVPDSLDGGLTFTEHPPGEARFQDAADRSLVSQGKVYELRRGATLVGSLQVATVVDEVSTTDERDRRDLLAQILTGIQYETIVIDGVSVAAARQGERAFFAWFGDQMFEVLQVKGRGVDPIGVLDRLIRRQREAGLLPADPTVGDSQEEEVWP